MEIIIDCHHPDKVYPVFMSIELLTGIRPVMSQDCSGDILSAALGTRFLHICNITKEQKERILMAMDMVSQQLKIKLDQVTGLPDEALGSDFQ